jgi:hypothetical protein
MAASMVASCGSDGGGQACTDLFAFITATAINGSGQPVSNLAIRDSVIRTATGFDISQEGTLNSAGTIVVFSDSYLANVRESGEPVLVSGTGAGLGFAAGYQFGTDGCHVRKISGPDTVVVH